MVLLCDLSVTLLIPGIVILALGRINTLVRLGLMKNMIITKNVVLLGDSRTVGIGVQVLKFDLTTKATPEGGKRSIISSTAKIYNGHSIKVVAQSGSHFATFVNTANAISTGAIKVLGASSSGTIVFLWLGVNNLNADATASYYKSLANKFKKLKFYAISVTGVSSE